MCTSREWVGRPKAVAWSIERRAFRRQAESEREPLPELFSVLGIETSCDDTGVAVVRSDGVVLGEAVASQASLHEAWGGVVPGLARDAHAQALDGTVQLALQRAGLSSVEEVDAVAVTVGPGLEICLRVGCEEAKRLALAHDKPFAAVHHLEAHVLMARLACEPPPPFPFLTLLVSGGHCQLLLSRGIGDHLVIGSTLDDALGEAYDKVARLLDLPTGGGGGPALEKLAREGDPNYMPLPVPLSRKPSFDFSFAGLKTAVRIAVERTPEEKRQTHAFRAGTAAAFQNAALKHLEMRITYAMRLFEEQAEALGCTPNTLVLSGGVAANAELRRRLGELCAQTPAPSGDGTWRMVVPPPRLCTDNGVMVAWAAIERLRSGVLDEAEGQEVRARWPLGRPITAELGEVDLKPSANRQQKKRRHQPSSS